MKGKIALLLGLLLILGTGLTSRTFAQKKDTLTVAFWNVENLFDTLNTNGKNDEEFSPGSKKQWNTERYKTKILHIAQVIGDMNNKRGPDMIGLAETETDGVVKDIAESPLKKLGYNYIRIQSPDERHISTALLYKKAAFKVLHKEGDTVHLANNHPTRLILHITLLDKSKDTLHVFVNHWPSRLGGQEASEPNRVAAAKELRMEVEKVLSKSPQANIFIMGDFNDEPDNVSIKDELKAEEFVCDSANGSFALHNLAWERKHHGEGTLKYRDQWNMLDQIIVSTPVINPKHKALHYVCGSFEIFKPDYLVQKGDKYAGSPFPTYGGSKYLGGYSDHFPVLAKFAKSK
jgi:predicted extracellular nuclease